MYYANDPWYASSWRRVPRPPIGPIHVPRSPPIGPMHAHRRSPPIIPMHAHRRSPPILCHDPRVRYQRRGSSTIIVLPPVHEPCVQQGYTRHPGERRQSADVAPTNHSMSRSNLAPDRAEAIRNWVKCLPHVR